MQRCQHQIRSVTVNKMALGVPEDNLHAEDESDFTSRQAFERSGIKTPKNIVFGHF